jgi:hypothetical protein
VDFLLRAFDIVGCSSVPPADSDWHLFSGHWHYNGSDSMVLFCLPPCLAASVVDEKKSVRLYLANRHNGDISNLFVAMHNFECCDLAGAGRQ